jgi:hypothetical protein
VLTRATCTQPGADERFRIVAHLGSHDRVGDGASTAADIDVSPTPCAGTGALALE